MNKEVATLFSFPRSIAGFAKILFSACSFPITIAIAIAALIGIEEAYNQVEKVIGYGTDENEP
ncbi:hypothetical protein [Lewinella sp. LCG006]|uniref:hypothetical protein n=1 Tax=Lewinella sp. LCG006 TaxID=3231911 RepID=UPI00345F74F9